MTKRLPPKEAKAVLQQASKGQTVDPATLRQAKATAKDHYGGEADEAMKQQYYRRKR